MPRNNQLRIIGGRFGGRKLSFPNAPDLRPTTDRIRETLFNWLAPSIIQARCLDLFAGSGALGIEAISRGAGETVFVESAPAVAKQLRANLMLLGTQHVTINEVDALHWLQNVTPSSFDIVFVDPPYAARTQEQVLTLLTSLGWVGIHSLIYVELDKSMSLSLPKGWEWHRDKSAGQVRYGLVRRAPDVV